MNVAEPDIAIIFRILAIFLAIIAIISHSHLRIAVLFRMQIYSFPFVLPNKILKSFSQADSGEKLRHADLIFQFIECLE